MKIYTIAFLRFLPGFLSALFQATLTLFKVEANVKSVTECQGIRSKTKEKMKKYNRIIKCFMFLNRKMKLWARWTSFGTGFKFNFA